MKKVNLKSLKLNKNSVSNLDLKNIQGGIWYRSFGSPCETNEAHYCTSNNLHCQTIIVCF
ncbi:hypothetical protein H2O64_07185 [Kordia sp. YSTF-M3]|uniref:Natural product n=1 Tax=Kordia aestuariivivens TaxID=2759037 RepID=A0ABR7Q7A6_9FLAO|nr:hypothetical protein [Kordia aestuariivivens]MBC8754450.1 hypothetical protein [Kordia aestuariivivens]